MVQKDQDFSSLFSFSSESLHYLSNSFSIYAICQKKLSYSPVENNIPPHLSVFGFFAEIAKTDCSICETVSIVLISYQF